jgi:hypothetical protein
MSYQSGQKPKSLQKGAINEGRNDAAANPFLQANSKAAEVVYCLWRGLDPDKELNWGTSKTDPGHDLWDTMKVDVKHITWNKLCLIWHIGKNDEFWDYDFDGLVLVEGGSDDFINNEFTVVGGVSKKEFWDTKRIAGQENTLNIGSPPPALHKGTWYTEKSKLHSIKRVIG